MNKIRKLFILVVCLIFFGVTPAYANDSCNHQLVKVSYTWSDDNKTCTASRTCLACPLKEIETVTTTPTLVEEKTCILPELTSYSANFTNTAFVAQEKTVQTEEAAGHSLKKTEGVAASAAKEGNRIYWHCHDCDKYFGDEKAETEITKADTVLEKIAPVIIKGDGASVSAGGKKALSFTSDAAYKDFICVELDGKTVDESNYMVKDMKKGDYSREVNIMNNEEKRCSGCGVLLQDQNLLQEGYTTSLENDVCQRCFRMKNYGEYQVVTKSNDEYLKILKSVGETKDLVLYITDLLNLEENIEEIRSIIPNKMILVLNKKDVLPKSVKEEKLINYLKEKNIEFEEVIVVSVNKNINIDYLLKRIKYYQTSKNVYVVGHTNAGKSSLINKLISNYSDNTQELTMSPLPSTTLNLVKIDINDHLTLIDTPGLVDNGSILNRVDASMVKKISPKKEIKPRTYQLRKNQSIIIEDLIRIDYVEGEKNSFTLFVSNDLKVKRLLNLFNNDELKDKNKLTYEVKYDEDLVINGLGFVKIVNKGVIDVYIDKDIDTFMRKSLI